MFVPLNLTEYEYQIYSFWEKWPTTNTETVDDTLPHKVHFTHILVYVYAGTRGVSATATPQLMSNQKWYEASKPESEFHMINMIYAALPIHAQTEKTTFSCTDDCTLTTRCWTYSALRYFFFICFLSSANLHVNFCIPFFFKASNWLIYWLLTMVLAPYLSN